MYLITAVIQPHQLEAVQEALIAAGAAGVTVSEVRGFGRQRGHGETRPGGEYRVDFVPKMRIEVVADVTNADEVLRAIGDAARTGEIGDGKVWVTSVEQVMRIRTGEMGMDAVV